VPADLARSSSASTGSSPSSACGTSGPPVQPQDLGDRGHLRDARTTSPRPTTFPKTATGAGQIIAIVGEAPVPDSDLTTFWTVAGVSQTRAT
jgi:hypothetical protein